MPTLSKAPSPTVIFTLDSRGHVPAAYWGSYAASKAGLEGLVRMLADEWASRPQWRVYGVIPGPIESPLRKRAYPGDTPGALPPISALVPLYVDLLAGGQRNDESLGPIIDAAPLLANARGIS